MGIFIPAFGNSISVGVGSFCAIGAFVAVGTLVLVGLGVEVAAASVGKEGVAVGLGVEVAPGGGVLVGAVGGGVLVGKGVVVAVGTGVPVRLQIRQPAAGVIFSGKSSSWALGFDSGTEGATGLRPR